MDSFTPVKLSGENLGQRHKHLNLLVQEAKKRGVAFQDIKDLPEQSPVDRLFKIDLAAKLKNVEYIEQILKDDDMLYVSRALKTTWLLDNHDIIDPEYLHVILFPQMITPAVSKMKHWLYINMRDAAMCQKFYLYYKEITFEFAVKFLSHCNNEFIIDEVPKVLTKLTPHSLKVLCEKCPKVAKIYYDSLEADEDVKKQYLEKEKQYYNSIKAVLKLDANVFLDITEKYFAIHSFSRLSQLSTDYILRHHKTRFTNKVELYAAYFLHIPTLAARLSVEECQEVVLKLARASYLQYWFQYKAVEPLIKRIPSNNRMAFKKRVFVAKDIGECVEKWPYDIPITMTESDTESHIFDDQDFVPLSEPNHGLYECQDVMRCYAGAMRCLEDECVEMRVKTDLDKLFDEFRFIGFDGAMRELSQRLRATPSADRRRDIFLVLVSKTGGREAAVAELLRLAVQHTNEPAHTRASIVRSLVKRANVWLLPIDDWENFLEFGHGLGLNGAPPEAVCREGLHAVMIRQLLSGYCVQAIEDAFLKDFTTLTEYSVKRERPLVGFSLYNMLVQAASGAEPSVAAERLIQVFNVIDEYQIPVNSSWNIVEAVRKLTLLDADIARPVLQRLYDAKIARRELLRLNMAFRRDEAALVNALRHDPLALELKLVVDVLAAPHTTSDRFTSKLVVYFNEEQDSTKQLRSALKEKIAEQQKENCRNVRLARPLATLLYKDFEKELRELDAKGAEHARVAAALRASAHRARPVVHLAGWGWRKAGVKAVATQVLRGRDIDRIEFTRQLAVRRTIKVALALNVRSAGGELLNTFESAAKLRPAVALRTALSYFRRHGEKADTFVWDIVKPVLSSIDLASRESLRRVLEKADGIPCAIKPEYYATFYLALNKISRSNADSVLCDICKLLSENDEPVEPILQQILDNTDVPVLSYPALFVRYLLLSRSDEDAENRFTKIGNRFLEHLDSLRNAKDPKFQERLDQVLESLLYNAAFLNTKFPSCLLVIQKILNWMQKFLPKEEHFKKYVQVHLTMLYFKAVRQSMKQMPDVFADTKRRKLEGVEAVGFIYGKYIAKEVAELVSTYFDSMLELYSAILGSYLSDTYRYGSARPKFFGSIIKGILSEAVGLQRRMAVHLLFKFQYDIGKEVGLEIEELLREDKELEVFVGGTFSIQQNYIYA